MTPPDGPQPQSLPPWLTVTADPAAFPASASASASVTGAAVLDGHACRTRAAFFTEVARVLRLPDYFGRNWDALTDAFRDLERVRSTRLALVVLHAEALLSSEPPGQFATLLAVLADAVTEAAEAAAVGEPPFTMTLCTDPGHEADLRLRVAEALT